MEDNYRTLIAGFLAGVLGWLEPIAGDVFTLIYIFVLNFFFGYLADRIANGNACGTIISDMYQKNWPSTSRVSPLPMSVSMYCHTNCIISTNNAMKNVPMKSSANCLNTNMYNFLMRSILVKLEDHLTDVCAMFAILVNRHIAPV